ncbi:hypothetical protein FRB99_002345 [Tulasnella sp. 403]|nr:hypothetical protein FRB99_002345 [Tulasnella sp. 403]
MGHHEVLAAVANGSHVMLCGHSNTERGYLPVLKASLEAELAKDLPDSRIDVVVSKRDMDPLEIV